MAGRKNGKEIIVDGLTTIKKSNVFSMSKLNQGLTLTQMQLLGYCIYTVQQGNGKTFNKTDFERTFSIDKYLSPRAREDAEKIYHLEFDPEVSLDSKKFKFWHVFGGVEYDNGTFLFEFTTKMLEHVTALEDNYLKTDLHVVANFKSSFSWTMYDYLKANYGCWYKSMSKEAVMNLFGVESKKSYRNNTGLLKKYVIDVAVDEINEHTELDLKCESVTQGRSIVGFKFTWSAGKTTQKATNKQMELLQSAVDVVFEDMTTYNKIKDKQLRESVLNIVREVVVIRDTYFDGEVGMSVELFTTVLKKMNEHIEKLNALLLQSGEEPLTTEAPLYDWLNS